MKKFMLVGCLLSAAMGLNTAFSSSHTDQIEVEFNKNNIYEEFTDEIEIPNSDKYFVNEETEPDLIIDEGKVEKVENYVVIPKDDFGILASNIKYPDEVCGQGRVIVSFVVEKDGSITNATIRRSVDPAFDREALRVISSMPKWIPGKNNGRNVRVRFNVPVQFKLQ